MRLKHNKKRNTAFVYEALVRELTSSVIKKNKNKQDKIVSIMKEHFASNSLLREELELYRSIYETKKIQKPLAEKIVKEAKQGYFSLDKKKKFKEQSDLINKINKTLSNKVFTNFVPNFKSLASVYSIFNEKLPPKDRVLLEEKMINEMSSSVDLENQYEQKHIDNIVYNSFVSNFNKEYSGILEENQKNLLLKYVSSFSDNGIELKIFLNEEIHNLKNKLNTYKDHDIIIKDVALKNKIDEVLAILEENKNHKIDEKMLTTILKIQDLVNQMESED